MTDIYLCRHGRTQLNVSGVLRGRLDPALDLIGRAEARELAEELSRLDLSRVVSSPLLRARETASAIAAAAGIEVELEERFIDRDYGRFNGLPADQVAAEHGTVDAAPGVEPAAEVARRAAAGIGELVGAADERPIVVVSHDIVIRLVLSALAPRADGSDHLPPRTGCWSLLRHQNDGWRLVVANSKDDPVETVLARS